MDQISLAVEPLKEFSKDSIRLVKRCTKPDWKGMSIKLCSYFTVIYSVLLNSMLLLYQSSLFTSHKVAIFEENFWRNKLQYDRKLVRRQVVIYCVFISYLSEFQKIAVATAIGFAIMGFIGFFVKLIHIPINNIIV